jgi:hypothetical protein
VKLCENCVDEFIMGWIGSFSLGIHNFGEKLFLITPSGSL